MSGEKHAGDPGPERHPWWSSSSVAVLVAAVAWTALAVLPERVAATFGAQLPGPGSAVTGAVAGGAAAACLVVVLAHRRRRLVAGASRGTVRRQAAAALTGALGAALVTAVREAAAGFSATQAGIAGVVLVATAGGVGLGMFAARGPVWSRACWLAVPIVFALDAIEPLVPSVGALGLDRQWLGAVLTGLALGAAVAPRRRWTWLMWLPALALVWFAQSTVLALHATLQQVQVGAGYLRQYPMEPLVTAADHLSRTLVTPGDHGGVAMWAIVLQVGVAAAAWRLRAPRAVAPRAAVTVPGDGEAPPGAGEASRS